jgi:hypothetical protein
MNFVFERNLGPAPDSSALAGLRNPTTGFAACCLCAARSCRERATKSQYLAPSHLRPPSDGASYRVKITVGVGRPMSALGQKQTSRSEIPMSALPSKADIAERDRDVRYVPPIADIGVVSSLNEKPRRHAGVAYLRG